MKKLVAVLLLLAMVLTGCGGTSGTVEEAQPTEVPMTAGVGGTVAYENLKITLDKAEYYEDSSDFPLDTPAEGKKYVLLWLTAENIGTEDDFVNMFNEESYCDDTAIDPEALMFSVEGETLWGDVASGKKRAGYVAYQVAEDWQNLEFIYQPDMFSDDSKMTFVVNSEDVGGEN